MKAMMFTYFSRSYIDWVHAGTGQLKALKVSVHGSWVRKPRPPQEHCSPQDNEGQNYLSKALGPSAWHQMGDKTTGILIFFVCVCDVGNRHDHSPWLW